MTVETFRKKVAEWKNNLPDDPSEWSFHGVKRDKNKKFPDGAIAKAIINGTKYLSGKNQIYIIDNILPSFIKLIIGHVGVVYVLDRFFWSKGDSSGLPYYRAYRY